MQQYWCKYFAHRHTLDPGGGVKTFFFLKVVMLHTKLKGMEHRTPCKHIFCPNTHHGAPWGGVKRSKLFFMKVVMLHIKLKGMDHRAPCKGIFCPYTHPPPRVGSKDQNFFFLNVVMLHIELKRNKYRPT